MLAQQLVAAGEKVLDIQPKLGSRVRLLSSGSSNKNDPNDAFSVAVAALRSPVRRIVRREDHTTALKLWGKRYQDLSRLRNQAACRPCSAARARHQLATVHVADLHHLDLQLRDTRSELTDAVKASGTCLTGIYGVGPVIAAIVIGDVEDITRFATRDSFASYNGTAPMEVSSGQRVVHRLSQRGNRRLNHAIHMVAVTQIRNRGTDGRAYYDKKLSEGKTNKEALRPSSGASATPSTPLCGATPATPPPQHRQPPSQGVREGNRGTTLHPARPARTPHASSSDQPLPDPNPAYDPPPHPETAAR